MSHKNPKLAVKMTIHTRSTVATKLIRLPDGQWCQVPRAHRGGAAALTLKDGTYWSGNRRCPTHDGQPSPKSAD